jgi:hypothetical protein
LYCCCCFLFICFVSFRFVWCVVLLCCYYHDICRESSTRWMTHITSQHNTTKATHNSAHKAHTKHTHTHTHTHTHIQRPTTVRYEPFSLVRAFFWWCASAVAGACNGWLRVALCYDSVSVSVSVSVSCTFPLHVQLELTATCGVCVCWTCGVLMLPACCIRELAVVLCDLDLSLSVPVPVPVSLCLYLCLCHCVRCARVRVRLCAAFVWLCVLCVVSVVVYQYFTEWSSNTRWIRNCGSNTFGWIDDKHYTEHIITT